MPPVVPVAALEAVVIAVMALLCKRRKMLSIIQKPRLGGVSLI